MWRNHLKRYIKCPIINYTFLMHCWGKSGGNLTSNTRESHLTTSLRYRLPTTFAGGDLEQDKESQRPWHGEWQAEECRTLEVRNMRVERCQMAMPWWDVSRLHRLQVLWPMYVGSPRWTWAPSYDTWGQSGSHEILCGTTGGSGGGKYSPPSLRETSRLASYFLYFTQER